MQDITEVEYEEECNMYNPKTHLYEVEENIIHDVTGKPTESKCRN